jgi:hypothetical protein
MEMIAPLGICGSCHGGRWAVQKRSNALGFNKKVARPVRFELTTYSFGGCRSIHLSYGRPVALHRKAIEMPSR